MNTSIANNSIALGTSSGFSDRMARNIIHKLLTGLSHGRLIIQENGEVMEYGEAREDASITANIHVKNPVAYRQLLTNGSIGGGEAYMAGTWDSPDLLQVVRLFGLNMQLVENFDQQPSWWKQQLNRVTQNVMRRNNRAGSKSNIQGHYDLSNDFFALFLDSSMMYSAAIFPSKDATLEQAAHYKIHHICERLQLSTEDHLLEIGSGWGGLAVYAAQQFGCKVTTTTISEEQYTMACQRVRDAGLENQVTVLKQDYRDLSGHYDKLVSVEMIEAVGHKYYEQYFRQCSSLLKPDGLMLIQAITIADQRYAAAQKSMDFIQKYIFPGGSLPSQSVIAGHVARDTDMQIVGVEDITLDYARTLAAWRDRFLHRIDDVKALGFDDVFVRMWEFYLAYCEGGFMERVIGTSQILMAKPLCQQLPAIGEPKRQAVLL
jgi:cyclopropane-fatty-acyl-phospholipid synthase